MFVMNFKLNTKKILILCVIIAVIISAVIEGVSIYNNSKNAIDYEVTENNFTSVLKNIHENIDKNIGKTIKVSGFIFTMPDFKENYFVCGRNMIMYDEAKVVGFLCEYDKLDELVEPEWVEISGVFVKGYYMCDMPVIHVKTLKKIAAPVNTFVEPPTD